MTGAESQLLIAFELHDAVEIRKLLNGGVDPNAVIKGKPAIDWLLEMYTRSDRFPDCVAVMLDRGAKLRDPRKKPVLLNDAAAIKNDPSLIQHRTTLICAFTPLDDAPLLHVAAEYGHLESVNALLEMGADVEGKAAADENGLNGHTAIYHTVNSHANRSQPVLKRLLQAGARCDQLLNGITWGRGFDWETACFDVTPLSYAQMGLLPQFQRKEKDIYENIQLMLARHQRSAVINNVPNKYQYPNGS